MIDGKAIGDAIGRAFVQLGCLCLAGGVVAGAIVASVLWWIFS